MQGEARSIPAALARLAADGADAGQIAATAAAAWRGVDTALAPIIGKRGVAALFKRSLHLTRADYPWLAAAHENEPGPGEFSALQKVLSEQSRSTSAAANGALLQAFHDLLATLIGASLTERLLQSVSVPPSSGHAVEDATS